MFPIAVCILSNSLAIALFVTAFVVSVVSNVEVRLTGPAGPVAPVAPVAPVSPFKSEKYTNYSEYSSPKTIKP